MDKFQKSQQHKQFNRNSDIDVLAEFKKSAEAIALAHYATGDMDAYVVGLNSIAKTDAKNDILRNQEQLGRQIAELRNALLASKSDGTEEGG